MQLNTKSSDPQPAESEFGWAAQPITPLLPLRSMEGAVRTEDGHNRSSLIRRRRRSRLMCGCVCPNVPKAANAAISGWQLPSINATWASSWRMVALMSLSECTKTHCNMTEYAQISENTVWFDHFQCISKCTKTRRNINENAQIIENTVWFDHFQSISKCTKTRCNINENALIIENTVWSYHFLESLSWDRATEQACETAQNTL